MGALTNQEAANGFTDELRITFEDFSVANAGTLADRATKTFTYTLPAGSQVRNCAVKLVTAFNDSGSGDDLTITICLLYTSPSPRDVEESRMPSSA